MGGKGSKGTDEKQQGSKENQAASAEQAEVAAVKEQGTASGIGDEYVESTVAKASEFGANE